LLEEYFEEEIDDICSTFDDYFLLEEYFEVAAEEI